MTNNNDSGKAAGGLARAKKMTPAERSAAASEAAKARWATPAREVISGSADSPLRIGNIDIECYVLDDGSRVLTQASMLRAMGRSRSLPGSSVDPESGMPPILQAKAIRPYIPDDLIEEAMPITFRLPNGTRAQGYRAELLPALCEVYLAARADGELPANQHGIARQAEILVRGLARVGIIALVDEATGYQDVRAKDALAQILEAYVANELQPWVKTFPVDFYREMFRLRDLEFDASSVRRPGYFGHLTNDVIYQRLAPGVLGELKKQAAKDEKKVKLHQRLTEQVGHPKLREHLASVIAIMKLSDNWDDFKVKLDRIHPPYREDQSAQLWNDDSGI